MGVHKLIHYPFFLSLATRWHPKTRPGMTSQRHECNPVPFRSLHTPRYLYHGIVPPFSRNDLERLANNLFSIGVYNSPFFPSCGEQLLRYPVIVSGYPLIVIVSYCSPSTFSQPRTPWNHTPTLCCSSGNPCPFAQVSYCESYFLWLRPLQFNYLSYKLFLEKKSCQTQKKKKKKSSLVSYGRKWFWNFLSDSKKKKVQVLRIFFVRVIQSTTGSYHCCSRASDLRRYTSHPSGYRD